MDDINTKMYSVIRRLMSVAKSNGFSIVTISILFDRNGDPVLWSEPKKTLIEPSSIPNRTITDLIELLSKSDKID